MVSGLAASDTVGCSVFQCADTARIAFGRGTCLPSEARKARAGRSFSRYSMGEPCETKRVGIDIASILAQHLKLPNRGMDHGSLAHLGFVPGGHMGGARPACQRSDDVAAGAALGPQGARP